MTTSATAAKKKTRLIVQRRDEYIALPMEDIAFICRDDLLVVVMDRQMVKYFCDKTLSELEATLDSAHFFRANRQYLLNINVVKGYKVFEKVKLKVFLKIAAPGHEIIVSQKTAPRFRKWLSED